MSVDKEERRAILLDAALDGMIGKAMEIARQEVAPPLENNQFSTQVFIDRDHSDPICVKALVLVRYKLNTNAVREVRVSIRDDGDRDAIFDEVVQEVARDIAANILRETIGKLLQLRL